MFKEPEKLVFKNPGQSSVSTGAVVVCVSGAITAKAYPLEHIVYHHLVQDSLENKSLLITYCGLCRSGRAFSPVVDGQMLHFSVAGLHHYNAIMEDAETKSWWYQEKGEAIFGLMKGKRMEEIFSEQGTLESFYKRFSHCLVMEPDPASSEGYRSMRQNFPFQSLPVHPSVSEEWEPTDIVVGVKCSGKEKAYLWQDLLDKKIINDRIGNIPVLVMVENDSLTFHALKREINGTETEFFSDTAGFFTDALTRSAWNTFGKCVQGEKSGAQLEPLPAYQEFWHSWLTFNPSTEKYKPGK